MSIGTGDTRVSLLGPRNLVMRFRGVAYSSALPALLKGADDSVPCSMAGASKEMQWRLLEEEGVGLPSPWEA